MNRWPFSVLLPLTWGLACDVGSSNRVVTWAPVTLLLQGRNCKVVSAMMPLRLVVTQSQPGVLVIVLLMVSIRQTDPQPGP